MSARGSIHRVRNDHLARPFGAVGEMLLDLTIGGTMMAAYATMALWELALGGRSRHQPGRGLDATDSPSVEPNVPDGHESSVSRAPVGQRGLARGFFNWSTGTIISNLADNPELGPLARKLIDEILPELAADPEIAALVRAQAGVYLAHLQEEPEQVEPLVQVLVGRYLASLQEHPEQLTPLVHELGDEYIAYLNEHPERVQGLLQRQGESLASEVIHQVRGRTITADAVAEMLVRSLLRRAPREQLPEPPPELKARAASLFSGDGRGPARPVESG